MGRPLVEYTVTSFEVNVTVQPASHMGPMITNIFVKVGMICPLQGIQWPCFGIGIITVADDDTTCPLAVPTCIFGATVFIGPCGACGAIYRCDVPVYAIPVYTFVSEVPT